MDCAMMIARHDQNAASYISFFEANHIEFYNWYLRKAKLKLYAA